MKTFIRWSTKFLAVCWLLVMGYTTADIYAAPRPKTPAKTVYISIVSVDPSLLLSLG